MLPLRLAPALLPVALPVVLPVVLSSLLLLASCGTRTADDPATTPASRTTAPDEGSRTDLGAEVTAVDRAPEGLRLTIRTDYATDGYCVTNPHARTQRENGVVHVTAYQDHGDPDDPGCLAKPTDTFELRVPDLQPKDLVATGPGGTWRPTGTAAYARCSEELGCYPPKDPCDPAWTRLVTTGAELPPEKDVDVLACADGWMVADVDAVSTGCHSVDGSTPPAACAGTGVHARWYARWLGPARGWNVVASGTSGCADVVSVPEFPQALCTGLPPR